MYTELRPNGFDVIWYTLEIRKKDRIDFVNMFTDWNFGAGDYLGCFYQPHMSNKKLQEMFTKKLINPTYANDYKLGFGFEMSTVSSNNFILDCDFWDETFCETGSTGDDSDDVY